MTARPLGYFRIGSPEWHRARTRALGGSEIAAVAGLSPWQSRFSVWHLKAGTLAPPEEDRETFKQHLGHVLEDGVARLFAHRHPDLTLRRSRALWQNTARPYQVGDVDRLIVPAPRVHRPVGLLECKTADSGDAWQWGPDGGDQDDVPPYYAAQALWYADLLGLHEVALAVLIGAREYREYTIRWSRDDVEFLRDHAVRFLDSLDRGQAPAIDGHEATYQAVRELHPEIDGSVVDVPHEVAQAFADARNGSAAAEAEWNRARAELATAMGTAAAAFCNGVKIADRRARGTAAPYVQAARGLPTTIPTERPAA